MLGPDALLAAALLVAATDDEQEALAIGRTAVEVYLTLDNYRLNFLRAGFTTDDLGAGGSERLIRALVVPMSGVAEAVGAHLEAGADHVSIGIRTSPGQDPREGYRRVAELLDLH